MPIHVDHLGSNLKYANLKRQLAREEPPKKGAAKKPPPKKKAADEGADVEYMGRKMGSNCHMMESGECMEGDMEREEGSNSRIMGGEEEPKKKGNPFAIANAAAKKHGMGPGKKERLIRHLKDQYGGK